jgi:hypothetical protein
MDQGGVKDRDNCTDDPALGYMGLSTLFLATVVVKVKLLEVPSEKPRELNVQF